MDKNKQALLAKTLGDINKRFGANSVMMMDQKEIPKLDVIKTGSYLLNECLGVGGYPKGRIIEIYGPESAGKTTLALHALAECQKAGGVGAIIDVEHALDPSYAGALGVNVSDLIISQPDCGEEALEIAESLVRSGVVDLIVVDSVAALVPKAEIEGEMGDASVGLQARLMSKACRKLVGCINQTNSTVIFINQIREKIGVMYGCLHGETLVNFVDGRSIPIKEVVENHISGKVWSLNEDTGEFEAKEIIDWHDNGKVKSPEDYIHFETVGINSNGGRFGFTVTPDHRVMTDKGWKEAKDITMHDKVMSKYMETINSTLADFMWGMFVGDSTITVRDKNTANLALQDNDNPEYMNWKIEKLAPFFTFKKTSYTANGKTLDKYSSEFTFELAKIKSELGNRNPVAFLLNHYSDLGMALWYMDDGNFDSSEGHKRVSISVKRFRNNKDILNEIKAELIKLGYSVSINYKSGTIYFDSKSSMDMFSKIAKYIPKCMSYKLPEEMRNEFVDFTLNSTPKLVKYFVPITTIRIASTRQMRNKTKYDISVEDNHNYMVGGKENGIIVHNSPETTTGGRALKFFSSVRLEIRKGDVIKDGSTPLGHKLKIKVVKNKVAPPFKACEVNVIWGKGIDASAEVIDIAIAKDIVQKSGAWFEYKGQRFQGRSRVDAFFEENPDEFNALADLIFNDSETNVEDVPHDALDD